MPQQHHAVERMHVNNRNRRTQAIAEVVSGIVSLVISMMPFWFS
jgi:hypothetical protein